MVQRLWSAKRSMRDHGVRYGFCPPAWGRVGRAGGIPRPVLPPRGLRPVVGLVIVCTPWCRWAARGNRVRPVDACPSGRLPAVPRGLVGEATPRRLGAGRLVRGRVGPVLGQTSRLAFGSAVMTAFVSSLSTTLRITVVPLVLSTTVLVWWASRVL